MVLMSTSPDRSRMSRQSCWSGPAASARFRSSLRMRPPHLGGGFPRKRDRKDVRRLDTAAQQVEDTVDEHMSLAGAG
jgi:hypothetical protein